MHSLDTRKLYYGFPIFVLTYPDKSVGWNMTTASSSYSLGRTLMFGLSSDTNAAAQIRTFGRCTLSLATADPMPVVEELGRLGGAAGADGEAVDKIAASGARLAQIPGSDAHYLEGSPLVIEVSVRDIHDYDGYSHFLADIIQRRVSDELVGDDGQLVSRLLDPVHFVGDDAERIFTAHATEI